MNITIGVMEMENRKIKVMSLSDHPMMPSGVAHSMRNILNKLVDSGKFEVLSLGGGVSKHPNYNPVFVKDGWVIYPIDDFGTQDIIRKAIREYRPDILLYQTDPRFFVHLHEMEHEIRQNVSTVWYGIWDNYPYPMFNKPVWSSVDHFVSISKVTQDCFENVVGDAVKSTYIPHSVNLNIFKKLPESDVEAFKRETLVGVHPDAFIAFWNNRNGLRKLPATLMMWWKDFLEENNLRGKAHLIMHTDPVDQAGQNLPAILKDFNFAEGDVIFSTTKVDELVLSKFYNMADVVVNIADAEGFGLGTLEALACETPIIVNMTGGLQEQVTDGTNWFGVGIEPASKIILGDVVACPYIYQDRISKGDFLAAMKKMYSMSKEDRNKLGSLGRKHVETNYNFDNLHEKWVNLLEDTYETNGSWPNKNFKSYEFTEI